MTEKIRLEYDEMEEQERLGMKRNPAHEQSASDYARVAKNALSVIKKAVKFEVEMHKSDITSSKKYKQLGILEKYMVVKEYFGLSAINIENVSRTYRER